MKNLKLLITGVLIACFAVSISSNNEVTQKQDESNLHACNSICNHSDDGFKTHCKYASSGKNYLTNIFSYEKDTIDGTQEITVILEAEDTSYIGNVFSFETLGFFFSGGGIYQFF